VLAPLLTDENPRVRAAGARAIAELGSADNADALRTMLRDPEKDVRRAAQQSLARLTERLELPQN
jgi:HEAT repeat protein